MEKILISACLLGDRVRYDGKVAGVDTPQAQEWLKKWHRQGRLVRVCPEVSGGMPVPRPPAQIAGGTGGDVLQDNARVVNENGTDVTSEFVKGAKAALELAVSHQIRVAVLKEKSPSCGANRIYDGTFSSVLMPGEGVTAALLRQNRIQVVSENELDRVERILADTRCNAAPGGKNKE